MRTISLRMLIALGCLAVSITAAASSPEEPVAEHVVGRADGEWERRFRDPPPECRPEVYWDWMGGLISKEGITRDVEALARVGIGGVLIMQLPDQLAGVVQWRFRDFPGKVRCLSDEWFALMNHAAAETDRLGLRMSFLMCPGWSHCGGPWITRATSLKVLVDSRTPVAGPGRFDAALPRAAIRKPAGEDRTLPGTADAATWEPVHHPGEDFYRDVAVLAVPVVKAGDAVRREQIIDLTARMNSDGRLSWDVPAGQWTVLRVGVASDNGPNHPAPTEAMGLECDRMDPVAVRAVFAGLTARIVKEARAKGYQSVQRFETDSYEAGRQDFCLDFPAEFNQRRGYDCTPWLPAWLDANLVIGSRDLSGRFRSDMLRTISELWNDRFYGELRRLADEHQLQWMIEPYFLMNHDWRTAGARAHLPGCEFWTGGPQLIGPAPDIAALYGHTVVWSEAFTAESYESAWRNDPWRMKVYGDAAYCQGINHFILHGFTHNPWDDRFQPGLTMGFWGTQMTRHTTWWPMAAAWHRYLARCHFLLQQGQPIADLLTYPPRAEHIPSPVLDAGPYRQTVLNDETLCERLAVRAGRIVLPHGTSYAALALVPGEPLRPEAIRKLRDLVHAGATLIGPRPPARSASLQNYPVCDQQVAELIDELWGPADGSGGERPVGHGRVVAGQAPAVVLDSLAGGPDFVCRRLDIPYFSSASEIVTPRALFFHRRANDADVYFISNQEDQVNAISADFRVARRKPELWDPVTGEIRPLPDYRTQGTRTVVPLRLEPRQSCFVVFRAPADEPPATRGSSLASDRQVLALSGPWEVRFDPQWGGPERITFDALADWTQRAESGIRYYSGTATYRKQFDLPAGREAGDPLWLDLGTVRNLARVRLNEQDLGVVWCAPWRVPITAAVQPAGNRLEIDVANTWVNRLIGDEQQPDDAELLLWDPAERKGGYAMDIPGRGLKDLPDWLIDGANRPVAGRFTFSSWRFYPADAPLPSSGLLGPVTVREVTTRTPAQRAGHVN